MNRLCILFRGGCAYVWNIFHDVWERMSATMSPYNASASAKIRMRIIPTKIRSYYALALTPASPTIPIANPAAFFLLFNEYHY